MIQARAHLGMSLQGTYNAVLMSAWLQSKQVKRLRGFLFLGTLQCEARMAPSINAVSRLKSCMR